MGINSYGHVLFSGIKIKYKLAFGEMAEWLIAPVLKTGIVETKNYRGFESLSLLFLGEWIFLLILVGSVFSGWLYHHLAEPEKKRLDINKLKRKYFFNMIRSTQPNMYS